jgi:hypothetical protein
MTAPYKLIAAAQSNRQAYSRMYKVVYTCYDLQATAAVNVGGNSEHKGIENMNGLNRPHQYTC